jgi:hypothetical protein
MKSFFTLFLFSLFSFSALSQKKAVGRTTPDSTKRLFTVEATCGKCKLGMPGKDCALAVRINGKAYYVDGVGIDDFGDTHAHDGLCNAIRKAEVQGEVVKNRFRVSYFKLLPEETKMKVRL